MSELMKKHHIEQMSVRIGNNKSKLFIMPRDEALALIKLLKKYQVDDENELIPWREGFKKLKKTHSSEGGIALKAERTMANMTQVQLAKKIDVPQHVISEMENGKRPIGKNMAKKLAAIFKTDYRLFL